MEVKIHISTKVHLRQSRLLLPHSQQCPQPLLGSGATCSSSGVVTAARHFQAPKSALISYCCYSNHHRASGLKQHKCVTTQLCRSEALKSSCQQGCAPSKGEDSSSPPPASGGPRRSGHVAASLQSLPPSSCGLLPYVAVSSPFLSLPRTHIIGFGAHPDLG